MEKILNFIGGELTAPRSGKHLPNFEPATGTAYSQVPDSDPADVEQAIEAAHRAFPAWSALSAEDRGRRLRALAQGIERDLEVFARAESVDTGKPLALARRMDIPRAAQNFSFFADAVTQYASESHLTRAGVLNYTLRHPLGVVACISPWNLPLYLLSWKIAPALAAGNCVVAKPSEVTPMTAFLLAKLCRETGLPPGVLNIVHGQGPRVGPTLVSHPEVAAVSFTGSTRVGAEIGRAAGPAFKRTSLEMGGKNATVVFADADFEEAVAQTLSAAFTNQGQICLCGSRIFVERPIYDRFRDALAAKAGALRVGDPLVEGTEQGALVSQAHYEKVLACIENAKKEGGRIIRGGVATPVPGRCEKGRFIAPTLIEGLAPSCQTNQEEIFGPVATLIPFDREEEALAGVNATRYGLAGSLWTRDLARAHRFAAGMHSGIVWINCWMLRDLRTPFGGVKESGVGREGGWEALNFFTEPKNVCLKY